jgi:ABC-2 type transport system permease protein
VSPAALAWQQFRLERRIFWRTPTAAFFNFVFPLLLLFLVAAAFANEPEDHDVLIPGIAAMGVMATTFTALGHTLVFRREEGILKRVRGTPMPAASYLAGLIGSAVVNAVLQVTAVVAIGHFVYGMDWPDNWALLAAFTALGVTCFGALGIAFAHAIPNVDSAPAYENVVFLPLIFISGVFYSTESLPTALEALGEVLPLSHLVDGLSSAITGSGGDATGAAAVIGAWTLAGLVLAVRFFRWS